MELRAYRAAKQDYERARTAKQVPSGPLVELVQQIEFALVKEEIADDARRAETHHD
jgi:hypothetical protein